ncbi:hypothetical protein PPS11_05663 [Pseudomonas putida S11]|nr:hypothetical protein PPS11_05663 [Pseudomonas putida S11]
MEKAAPEALRNLYTYRLLSSLAEQGKGTLQRHHDQQVRVRDEAPLWHTTIEYYADPTDVVAYGRPKALTQVLNGKKTPYRVCLWRGVRSKVTRQYRL